MVVKFKNLHFKTTFNMLWDNEGYSMNDIQIALSLNHIYDNLNSYKSLRDDEKWTSLKIALELVRWGEITNDKSEHDDRV